MVTKNLPLSEERLGELQGYLDYWLEQIQQRVDGRATRWIHYRRLYEGKPQAKEFPWPGASNVFVPMVGWTVDSIHANMMNRIYGYDRLNDIIAARPAEVIGMDPATNQPITWYDAAEELQKFLAHYTGLNGPVDLYPIVNDFTLETLKLGTSVIYNPWLTLQRTGDVTVDRETGQVNRRADTTIYDAPHPYVIPLEDFISMPGYGEIHGPFASPIVGHYSFYRDSHLRLMSKEWREGALETILQDGGPSWGRTSDEVKNDQARNEGDTVLPEDVRGLETRLAHLWMEYDINGDGLEERIYVEYDPATSTVARCIPYPYRTRPYVIGRFIKREGRLYGIGVAEILEYLQAGLNTVYNQAIDNGTLANTRFWKIRKGSWTAQTFKGVVPNGRVYVDQPDDVVPEQMGEIYPSIFELARGLEGFGERRSGIADPQLGRDPASRTPATSTMAFIQEATRRFDLYAKDLRRGLGELGMQIIELIQQKKPREAIYNVSGPNGAVIEKTILVPTDVDLRQHLRVVTTSSAASSNKEISRQNALAGFSIVQQYLEKIVQMGGLLTNPQAPDSVKQLLLEVGEVGERLMNRILEGFDLSDVATMMPQLEKTYERAQAEAASQAGGMGLPGGVPPGGGGPIAGGPGGGGLPPGVPGAPGPGPAGPPPPGAPPPPGY